MKLRHAGFGLIELMVALALGMLVVLAVTQMFLSARHTYLAQHAAAMAQQDARFVLSKIAQEIRMTGMFGCLATEHIIDAPSAFQIPITWQGSATSRSLTLISADVGSRSSQPDWTVVSDCKSYAQSYPGSRAVLAPGETAFAVRKNFYWFEGSQLKVGANKAVLLDNVSAFDMSFGVSGSGSDQSVQRYETNPTRLSTIRSVRLTLALRDPGLQVKDQVYHLVVALRNRLG